jgi:hypothetical protein
MQRVELSWEDWRAVVAALRAKTPPSKREHANVIEERLEEHAAEGADRHPAAQRGRLAPILQLGATRAGPAGSR